MTLSVQLNKRDIRIAYTDVPIFLAQENTKKRH